MLACQKHHFDLGSDRTYLNAAYMGPLPIAARDAGVAAAAVKAQPWNVSIEDFFEPVQQVRNLYAQLLNGGPEGIALVPSVSYGIAVAARNVTVRPGQRIVVLAEQFPSNVYVWRDLAHKNDAVMVTVARPEQGSLSDAVLGTIDERTAVVAVPHCHWMDGTRLDLVAIGARCREVGAALVVDGCQSIGAMPLDVNEVQPDFLTGGAYKWLLGPYASGFLWVHERHREGEPIEFNWINRAQSEDFAGLVNYRDEYQPGARRFDMGEVSNFSLIPQLQASLTLMNEWGPTRIAEYASVLTTRACDGAQALGLGVTAKDERSPHLVGIRLRGQDPKLVAAKLADAKVHVSVRGDSIRIAAHVFNDASDIQRLLEVLAQAV